MPGAENTFSTLPRPGLVQPAGEFPDFFVGHFFNASSLNDCKSSNSTPHVAQR